MCCKNYCCKIRSRMDGQTYVSQYFTARKNNSTGIHPSKRRKVEIDHCNVISVKDRVIEQPKKTQAKPKRKLYKKAVQSKENKLTIKDIFNSSPVVFTNAVTTETLDDHSASAPKRRMVRPVKISAVVRNLGSSSSDVRTPRNSTSETVKSTVDMNKDPSIASTAAKHIMETTENVSQVPPSSSGLQNLCRRSNLRQKYAHLLKKNFSADENAQIVEKVSSTCSKKNNSIISTENKGMARERPSSKYKHLVQKPISATFALPQKYKILVDTFRCADSILFLLNQRNEVCTFDRLKKSVQTMSGREFTMTHLACLKTVFPNGYIFRQERNLHKLEGDKTSNYQLTIEATFKESLPKHSAGHVMSSSVLITRRLKFESRLVDLMKVHHQKFLRKMNLKIDDKDIHRWHPNFKLESVPDVEASSLPQVPLVKGFLTAVDILAKNSFVPKVENALKNVADKSKKKETIETSTANQNTVVLVPNQNTRLKDVSSALLERIRLKEQKKHTLAMLRDPALDLRVAQMERLPEIARILKAFFLSEKKAAITLEDCMCKLTESTSTSLKAGKCEDYVRLLAELVPQWITIVTVRNCSYVKLARNYDINDAVNIISVALSREKSRTS